MTKAILKNYRQSPRKVRLIADAIRGKKVEVALTDLSFMAKRAAEPVKKVLESAIANAKNAGVDTKTLIVKEITVDEGITLKRWMPKARGNADPIRKRTSHIKIALDVADKREKGKAKSKDAVVKEVKTETIENKKPAKKTSKKAPTKKIVKKVTKSKK